MFVFVPELFKCNSKLLWRLGSLNGLREAVPKQCSMEEKTVLVACGAYFGKGYLEWFASVAGGAGRKKGYPCSRNRESNFFLTDLLTFLLFSSSGNCLKIVATDFFYSFPTISGDETKSGYVEKHLFLYVSKYFGRLTFEL